MHAERLKEAGIDYDADLYEAVLAAYVSDTVLERAQEAFKSGDRDKLLKAAHEAKGSSGNADLSRVYAEASALVALLRSGAYTQNELTEAFHRFEAAYTAARNGIWAALEG